MHTGAYGICTDDRRWAHPADADEDDDDEVFDEEDFDDEDADSNDDDDPDADDDNEEETWQVSALVPRLDFVG